MARVTTARKQRNLRGGAHTPLLLMTRVLDLFLEIVGTVTPVADVSGIGSRGGFVYGLSVRREVAYGDRAAAAPGSNHLYN